MTLRRFSLAILSLPFLLKHMYKLSTAAAFSLALLVLALASPADAQMTLLGAGCGGVPVAGSCSGGGGYTGPGDLLLGWSYWGGLRAFAGSSAGTKSANICNSGDANCADVNTLANGNFDVATAQGAPLNCGGTGGTCTVKTLYDKSGNARDATQATIGNRPTLAFNCINTSLPCMVFVHASHQELQTGGLTVGPPNSMTGVAMQTANTDGQDHAIIADTGFTNELTFHNVVLGLAGCNGGGAAASESDSAFHAFQAVCATGTGTASITVDGTTTTGNATAAGTANNPLTIGGLFFLEGKIVEAGFVGGNALSGSDITALCHNQRLYWGTSGSC